MVFWGMSFFCQYLLQAEAMVTHFSSGSKFASNHFTDGSCFVIVSSLEMIIVAIGAVELSMTDVTGLVGHRMVSRTASLFGCEEVRAIFMFA